MSRFKELGYTPEDFAPNKVFVTQKAAETAMAAGITQIRPLRPEIELLRDYIDRHTTDLRYKFPAEIDELSFVLRWYGKGARWMWQWDTTLHNADPNTRFLNAWNLSVSALDELRLGGEPAGSQTLDEMNPFMAVEISVESWENPRLTKKFVDGVLFNRAQRRGRPTAENLGRDFHEAFDRESLSRFDIAKMAEFVVPERPFDDIMPIVMLRPGDTPGETSS